MVTNSQSDWHVTRKLTLAALRALGPVGESLAAQVCTGNYKAVLTASIDPSTYGYDDNEPDRFARDYLAVNLIRKLDCIPTGIDREAAARQAWLDSEDTCGLINRLGKLYNPIRPIQAPYEAIIQIARSKMAKLLGPLDLDEVHAASCFSSGASTRLRREVGHPYYKFQGKPEVTREAALAAVAMIWASPVWREYCKTQFGRDSDPTTWVTVVPGSVFSTVPKDAKVERVVLFEPELNMLMQKGTGALIRARLRSVGINLNDQSRNQQLAWIGSRTGSLATIDLKAASDSISCRIVRDLLPTDWFHWLDRIRSHRCNLSGRKVSKTWHVLEKFSSMGNGFTFELESALFWCLSAAVQEYLGIQDRRLGIYGDDIIIHHEAVPTLIDVLSYLGFAINEAKSFWQGPFRESCGKHYFLGRDVTPLYVKHSLGSLDQLYWYANSLRGWSERTAIPLGNLLKYVVTRIPMKHRLKVPASLGLKAGLHATFDEAVPRYSKRRQMFLVKVYQPRRNKHQISGFPAYLSVLQAPGDPDSVVDRSMIDKGKVKYRHKWRYMAVWD